MKRYPRIAVAALVIVWALAPLSAARADFEVTGPDGRRILLKDDNTWRFVETEPEKPEEKPVVLGEGVLSLERLVDLGMNCQIAIRLQNDTNYEVQSIVPRFVVYRANGIHYEARTLGFYSINPGNSVLRETLFRGIACQDIGRIQVSGGDRCVMGDLDRISYTGGACLERVRVVPSDLVRFDK
jgi:hypothetical protein